MSQSFNAALVSASLAFAGPAVAAVEGPVGRDAEKGDPARWYRPADTPRLQYENAMQEAGAALAEALAECRRLGPERGACEREARERHEEDIERARHHLIPSTWG